MDHNRKISVIGLGYVGLSTAAAFGKLEKIIGFDTNVERVSELKTFHDSNEELSDMELKKTNIFYTWDPKDLTEADFHIIAVPTPIDNTKHPDFSMLVKASEILGKNLKKGDIIVYESTVYPGATEEIAIPVLERFSNLKCGDDFTVGYSPERINPGDKQHTLQTVLKIVSAMDPKTLDIVASVYESVVSPGVHRVSSIRIAEATKVVENIQRDINISLVNEIALILHTLNVDISEVLKAAETKWNYTPYRPGLVGGHCIGVNSYYLAHKSEEAGYHPNLILAGRKINDLMPKFIARESIKKLIFLDVKIKNAKVGVLGFTYKENCKDPKDPKDSKVFDLIHELKSYQTEVLVHDPIASPEIVKNIYGIELISWENLKNLDILILAVAHKQYVNCDTKELLGKLKQDRLIVDIKGILDPLKFSGKNITLWQL